MRRHIYLMRLPDFYWENLKTFSTRNLENKVKPKSNNHSSTDNVNWNSNYTYLRSDNFQIELVLATSLDYLQTRILFRQLSYASSWRKYRWIFLMARSNCQNKLMNSKVARSKKFNPNDKTLRKPPYARTKFHSGAQRKPEGASLLPLNLKQNAEEEEPP